MIKGINKVDNGWSKVGHLVYGWKIRFKILNDSLLDQFFVSKINLRER